jgi:hypothetical protein
MSGQSLRLFSWSRFCRRRLKRSRSRGRSCRRRFLGESCHLCVLVVVKGVVLEVVNVIIIKISL